MTDEAKDGIDDDDEEDEIYEQINNTKHFFNVEKKSNDGLVNFLTNLIKKKSGKR